MYYISILFNIICHLKYHGMTIIKQHLSLTCVSKLCWLEEHGSGENNYLWTLQRP